MPRLLTVIQDGKIRFMSRSHRRKLNAINESYLLSVGALFVAILCKAYITLSPSSLLLAATATEAAAAADKGR